MHSVGEPGWPTPALPHPVQPQTAHSADSQGGPGGQQSAFAGPLPPRTALSAPRAACAAQERQGWEGGRGTRPLHPLWSAPRRCAGGRGRLSGGKWVGEGHLGMGQCFRGSHKGQRWPSIVADWDPRLGVG